MIRINSRLAFDERELKFQFMRASGPGGQNVNKVETAVKLRFDVIASPSLPEDVRARLMSLAGSRLTADGELLIEAQRFRSQERNRQDAIARLVELIREAAVRPKARVATRPTLGSKRRRLEDKRQRGETKRARGPVED